MTSAANIEANRRSEQKLSLQAFHDASAMTSNSKVIGEQTEESKWAIRLHSKILLALNGDSGDASYAS
jgi:hypothetical protein